MSAAETFAEPSSETDHEASPVAEIVRGVVHFAALPVVLWFQVGTVPVMSA